MSDEASTDAVFEETDDKLEVVSSASTLEALNRSEIDQQIVTAKKYPRSITTFKQQCMEMACLDEETAGSMFYVLPRGGKRLEGPSVRLAEIVASCWGNVRHGSRILGADDKWITSQGFCFDLEKNAATTIEAKRRITDRQGKRFNDDMIGVTANAAASIAFRNAVFRIIPRAMVKSVLDQAKLVALGNTDSIQARREKCFDYYLKAGATIEQLLAFLHRKGLDDISVEDLICLKGLATSIKSGEITLEAALSTEIGEPGSKAKTSPLTDKIGKKGAKAEPPVGAVPPPKSEPPAPTREPGAEG